jgi:hypothetical protein
MVTGSRRAQLQRMCPGHPACVVEVYVHGLLYLRIERCPRWLVPALAAVFPAVSAWLLTR